MTFENIFSSRNIFRFLSFVILVNSFLVNLSLSLCKQRSLPFPVSNNLISTTVLASNICFSALLILLLRNFIKYLWFLIFVHFIGFLFYLFFITMIVGFIGFEIFLQLKFDNDISQLLPMEI